MNDPDQISENLSPREELEVRILALLLGEANEAEKEELESLLASDSQLQAYREQMEKTLGLAGKPPMPSGIPMQLLLLSYPKAAAPHCVNYGIIVPRLIRIKAIWCDHPKNLFSKIFTLSCLFRLLPV